MEYLTPMIQPTDYSYLKLDVEPAQVYGDVPLTLPMLKMSDADSWELRHELPDYITDRPLDQDTLWSVDLSQRAMFGLGALVPGYALRNATHVKANALHRRALMGEFGLGATAAAVARQAAAAQKAAAAAAAKAAAANAAATAKANAAAALAAAGASAAKQAAANKAAAAAATKAATATNTATTKQATATTTAATATSVAAAAAASGATGPQTKASAAKAANNTTAQTACTTVGGVWSKPKQTCNYTKAQKACTKSSGTWDPVNNVCGNSQSACLLTPGNQWNGTSCVTPAMQTCTASGGTWDPVGLACQQSAAQQGCINSGGTWANNQCTANPLAQTCANQGGTWANGLCTGATIPPPPPGSNCPTTPTNCPTAQGYTLSADANGCMTVCTPPAYNPNAYNPNNPNNIPYGGGGGAAPMVSPIPPGSGGDSSGGGGGVSAALPPVPPDAGDPGTDAQSQMFDDSANQFAPSVDQSQYQGSDQSGGDQSLMQNQDQLQQGDGSTDDASAVAMSNMASTVGLGLKTMFAMTGLSGVGCNACANTSQGFFGLGHFGAVAPKKKKSTAPDYVTAKTTPGIANSTIFGVGAIAAVGVLAAGAFYLFSRGGKKSDSSQSDYRPTKKNRGRRARLARRMARLGYDV